MRATRICGWLVATALLLTACGGQPDIAMDVKRHDFGVIRQGEVVTARVAVRNTGQRDLRIEAVSTSCGCTTAEVEPDVIPPGSEGTLTIRYDSGVHPDSGQVRRDIFVASNDPDEPEVVVIITAEVQAPGE